MTVKKFRSVDEMPPVPRLGGTALWARIRATWARARRLTPPLDLPRGVHLFRSIEESNAAREAAVLARMRATGRS